MTPARAPERDARGVVVSAHPDATAAGRAAFAAGGNAVDAAVTAAWALCVCEPSGSGLGGQSIALVRSRGRTFALDGHSRAPLLVSRKAVSRAQQRSGYRATTVPTTPMVLSHLQRRYGRLSATQALAPAIELAERGYAVTALQHRQLRWCAAALASSAPTRRFLRDSDPFAAGDTFRQPYLAACLRRLAGEGIDDFYRGAIARAIDRDMVRHDGLLRLADLQALPAPVERDPLVGGYGGLATMTAPAPGGGPHLLHALRALEGPRVAVGDDDDRWYLAVAHAVREAFESREREHSRSGDSRTPDTNRAAGVGAPGERGGETTHLCAADGDGNVVALTQSIQSLFGAKVANDRYGFLYNNYLTTCPRRRHAHRLRSEATVRSNAAPTFLCDRETGEPRIALGAAGSRRIISSIVQVVSGMVDLGLPIGEAVGRARVHPIVGGRVLLERPAATPTLVAGLGDAFGQVDIRPRLSYVMGAVQALEITRDRRIGAAADPRRDGSAERC